jgi:CO/xanthine dehydrogenase FAD-binding subunit
MPVIERYHRPQDIEEALGLIMQKSRSAAILAGGTALVPRLDDDVLDVIDLQSLALDQVDISTDRVIIGAMTRLQRIVAHEAIPSVVRQAAKLEGPNTLRNAATVGGTLIQCDWTSELYAALLAFDAEVTVQTAGDLFEIALQDFDADDFPDGIVIKISFATNGAVAHERLARTPADSPIVATIGRRDPEGEIRLAFCGVAEKPLLLTLDELQSLIPPGDFRGSSEYRRAMATVLARRVIKALT